MAIAELTPPGAHLAGFLFSATVSDLHVLTATFLSQTRHSVTHFQILSGVVSDQRIWGDLLILKSVILVYDRPLIGHPILGWENRHIAFFCNRLDELGFERRPNLIRLSLHPLDLPLARIAHRSPSSGVFGRRDVAKIAR